MNSALSFFSSKLAGFSTNIYNLSVAGKTSDIQANDQVIINLPSSCIVDCRSVKIYCNAYVLSGASGRLPGNLEKLFSRVEILIGGQAVSATNNMHNVFLSMKECLHGKDCNMVNGHPTIVRSIGDVSSVAIGAAVAEVKVGTTPASGSAVLDGTCAPYCIELSETFLSTVQPRFLDASLINSVQIRLTMAPDSVLTVSTNNTVPTKTIYDVAPDAPNFCSLNTLAASYQIDNLTATCSCISFASSEYDVLLSDQMSTEGFLSLPFTNVLGFRQSHTGSSKFQLSTRSLDRVYFGFLYTGSSEYGVAGTKPTLKNSSTINAPTLVPGHALNIQETRPGSEIEVYRAPWETFVCPSKSLTCQLSINNSFIPQAPISAPQLASLTELSTGSRMPSSTNLLQYLSTDFVGCVSFELPGSGEHRVSSGIDARSQNLSSMLQTVGTFDVGTTPSWDSVIFASMTSECRISVGRSLSVIM